MLLEICVDSINSALAAEKGGAARIELCTCLGEGGLTPSLGILQTVKKLCNIPVFVLIRSRSGDFCYNEHEIEVMCQDIRLCKDNGADGFVIGALTKERCIDASTCNTLIANARPLPVTFHRAFDLVREPLKSLEQVISLGCERLLTSGQAGSAVDGIQLISQLVLKAKDRIIIMPGGGINDGNLAAIYNATGVKEIHSSASHTKYSEMVPDEKSQVKMGANSSEHQWKECSVDYVQKMISICKNL